MQQFFVKITIKYNYIQRTMKRIVIPGIILIVLFIGAKYSGFIKPAFVDDIKQQCAHNKDYDGCYTDTTVEIAIAEKDISICEKGPILFSTHFNESRCYSKYIEIFNSPDECNVLKTNRHKCLRGLALHKNDSNICLENLDNPWAEDPVLTRDSCLTEFSTEGIHICEQMDNSTSRTTCVTIVATQQSDANICDQYIQREDEAETFKNAQVCRYQVAKDTNNKALCDTIQIDFTRQLCHESFK